MPRGTGGELDAPTEDHLDGARKDARIRPREQYEERPGGTGAAKADDGRTVRWKWDDPRQGGGTGVVESSAPGGRAEHVRGSRTPQL